MFVYKIENLINDKIYVGKTIKSLQKRFNEHIYESENGSRFYLHKAIRKYGKENFKIVKLLKCSNLDILNKMEIFFINKLKSNSIKFGYNMTSGGEGGDYWKGKKFSDEHRLNISNASKKYKDTYEYRKKLSESVRLSQTDEVRKKMSESHKGKPKFFSDEHKRKLSESAKRRVGNKNPNFGKKWTLEQKEMARQRTLKLNREKQILLN